MSRLRLLRHGVGAGLVIGVLGGVVDAVTTRHTYLDRSFLAMSTLAWVVCAVAGGAIAGLAAAIITDPSRDRGPRSGPRLAALLTAGAVSFAAAFQLLVWANVSWLASDTGKDALLTDAGILIAALAATALLTRLFEPAYRDSGPGSFAHLLLRPGPAAALAVLFFGIAVVTWRGGVGDVSAPEQEAPDDAPNVVLLLLDTLRRDHLSGEGYSRLTSPGLDALADRGARFSSLVSTSCYTKPAVASLLTSLYPSGHRVGHLRTVLPEDRTTLAEAFHDAGWRTAKFVSNTIIGPEFGFAQGTELFVTLPSELVPKTKLGYALFRLTEPGRETPGLMQIAAFLRRVERTLTGRRDAAVLALKAPEVIDAFTEWRGTLDDEPYFAYLHFMEPHAPYRPSGAGAERFASSEEPFVAEHPPTIGLFLPFSRADEIADDRRRGMIRAYDAEIAGLDRILEPFLEQLAREVEAGGRRTIVAVTSDHGEEFYEHGGWGHGQSLHDELLRVPFLLAGAGVPAGVRIEERAQIVDVGPTLLDLAGVPVPPEMAGLSQVPLLVGGEVVDEASVGGDRPELAEIVYGETYWARALRLGRWKIIVGRLGDEERVQLFDVEADPDETEDLADELPDQVAALRALLEARVAEAEVGAGAAAVAEFDPVSKERLRALGYVD